MEPGYPYIELAEMARKVLAARDAGNIPMSNFDYADLTTYVARVELNMLPSQESYRHIQAIVHRY